MGIAHPQLSGRRRQTDDAGLSNLDIRIEFQQMVDTDGRNHQPGKTRVGIIDAPADRYDPFAGGTAANRRADVRGFVRCLQMVLKELALPAVDANDFGIAREDANPVSVVQRNGVNLRQRAHFTRNNPPETLNLFRPDAVLFDTFRQADQHQLALLENAIRVGAQRSSQIDSAGLDVFQSVAARGPCLPGHQHHHAGAHYEDQP